MPMKDELGNQTVETYPGQGFVETIKSIYNKIKSGDPNELTSSNSVAQQLKRRMNPEDKIARQLNPSRQQTPPQTSHRDHYNDQEDYN